MEAMTPKPADVTWSDEQWQAMTAQGQNILVAAAAGSGKTAVLVERIIKKITQAPEAVDVDRLLVVTFTNAAAAEMKSRVGRALEEALAADPSSLHLRRQLSLLNRASISTLHAFCMNVLRRYYYKVDLDPAFRVVEQTEAELMREEVMEALFEDEYGKAENDAFYTLVDRYSGDRSDTMLQKLVGDLYDFARSHPRPEEWLDHMAARYEVDEDVAIDDLVWTQTLRDDVAMQLQGCQDMLAQAGEYTYKPGGPDPYQETFAEDWQLIDQLLAACRTSWSALYEAFQSVSFRRLKTVKGDAYDENLKEQAKELRDAVKKQVHKIKEDMFSRRPDLYLQDLREMAPHIRTLAELVKNFGRRYREAKNEKALVDFADLEHDCLQVLTEPQAGDGPMPPSDAARDYQEQFAEVLVDEYQDTNLVQETILQLITKEDNLFMVGDVKQSIYRFRLAEPGLFLKKYQGFQKDGNGTGLRIDLAKNFRSRRDVIDGTNYLFRQLMNEKVGEIAYDQDAELRQGAADYPDGRSDPEMLLIDREEGEEAEDGDEPDMSDLQAEQLEARLISDKIKTMIAEQYEVSDKASGQMRPITYRDIVVLMRSAQSAAPTLLEEFKRAGIPSYAESSSGYFEAIEVEVMIALLHVIDNPHQDIAIASVLRSPIVGLNGEEMAQIRIADKKSNYYEAMLAYMKVEKDELSTKLQAFYDHLQSWRWQARQGSLADLIWQIFRETGYYEFVAGMPGGRQRQANLRALYDRARQYESTSFRGLFRFLRFVERMRDQGSDLGTARALGEQEDVVRVMTVHKSKGLEYPVVFMAGLGKQFNFRDLRGSYMLDKDLGFGTKYINPKLRISYPTLPMLAMKQKMKMEMIAEEMRVLYVALTRAQEKLFLVGTLKDAAKTIKKWGQHAAHQDWLLPDHIRAEAKRYIDWIGPALIRHRDGEALRKYIDLAEPLSHDLYNDTSRWEIGIVKATALEESEASEQSQKADIEQALQQFQPVPFESEMKQEVKARLTWTYGYPQAAVHMSKQTVSEIKRQRESLTNTEGTDNQYIRKFRSPIAQRPRFMQQKADMSGAETGTVMHTVMQHLDLSGDMTEDGLNEKLSKMVVNELMTEEEIQAVDTGRILQFFQSELGLRMLQARRVEREVPFSLALTEKEAYADWGEGEDSVLVQGVVDCLIEEPDGLVLVDYKTDAIHSRFADGFAEAQQVLADRYRVQLDMYARAIEQIWKQPLKEKYLYFFDGGHVLKM